MMMMGLSLRPAQAQSLPLLSMMIKSIFDHHYDIEIDWSSDRDCFTLGQSVNYHHAPNLGGAAGVAALQTRWEPGVIKRRIPSAETDDFHLHEVTSADGRSAGNFSKRQLKERDAMMTWTCRQYSPVLP